MQIWGTGQLLVLFRNNQVFYVTKAVVMSIPAILMQLAMPSC